MLRSWEGEAGVQAGASRWGLDLASVSSLEGHVPAQRDCILRSVSAAGHHLIQGTGQRRCLSLGEKVCLKLQRGGGAQYPGLGGGRAGTESQAPLLPTSCPPDLKQDMGSRGQDSLHGAQSCSFHGFWNVHLSGNDKLSVGLVRIQWC